MAQADQYADARWPEHGLDLAHGFAAQPELTTPVGTNVRTWEPVRGRARGGQRPGLEAHAAGRLPTAGLVQELNAVVWKTPDALPGGCCSLWDDPATTQDTSSLESLYLPFLAESLGGGDPSTLAVTADPNTGVQVRTGGTGDAPARTTRRVPTLTWTPPGVMVAGNPLSAAQQNATATDPTTGVAVAGTFQYFPVAGTVPDVGVQTLGVLFTPSDTSYCCVTAAVTVTVTAISPASAAFAAVDPWASGGSTASPSPASAALAAVSPTAALAAAPSPASAAFAAVSPTPSAVSGTAVGPFTVFPLGTFAATGLVTTWSIPSITTQTGDFLFFGIAQGWDGTNAQALPTAVTWNGNAMTVGTTGASAAFPNKAVTAVFGYKVTAGATGSIVVTWAAGTPNSGTTRAANAVRVTGLGTGPDATTTAGAAGSNSATTLTATTSAATLHTPEFCYALLGTGGPSTDAAGAWSGAAGAPTTFTQTFLAGQRGGTAVGSNDATAAEAYAAVATIGGTVSVTDNGFTAAPCSLILATYY